MTRAIDDVKSLYRDLISAWNSRDAGAMAALYGARGTQIGFDGTTVKSPPAIVKHLVPIFRDHPTAAFVTLVREVRMIGPETAILSAVAGMLPSGRREIDEDYNAVQTLIASRAAGRWQVELFQNTPAAFDGRDDERADLTKELQQEVDGGFQ